MPLWIMFATKKMKQKIGRRHFLNENVFRETICRDDSLLYKEKPYENEYEKEQHRKPPITPRSCRPENNSILIENNSIFYFPHLHSLVSAIIKKKLNKQKTQKNNIFHQRTPQLYY